MILKCGKEIIERNNSTYLLKAKSIWSSNPSQEGAVQAREYLSKVIVSSSAVKKEVDNLNKSISTRLIDLDNKAKEMEQARMLSQERLQIEQIQASARTTSAFISIIPNLVYNILRWF